MHQKGDEQMESLQQLLFNIALHQGRYTHPLSLLRSQAKVYSENGEDGIIADILSRIGAHDHFFVEIGTGSGIQNNTRFWLEQGWRGVWIEGNQEDVARAQSTFSDFTRGGALKILQRFVTAENVNETLDELGIAARFDLLSLDVDQNTGHVWRAISRRCRVACIEYNASLPPCVALQAPYQAETAWDGTNWFGAGLKALEVVGNEKSMSLVGCELAGINAFFVNSEEAAGRFREPFTAEAHYEPPRYGIGSQFGHPLSKTARSWVPIGVSGAWTW
jgi:hypothetical protein